MPVSVIERLTTALQMPLSYVLDKRAPPASQTLEELIRWENGAFYSLRNDSIIHVISDATVNEIEVLIRLHATAKVTVPLLTAWIRGESRLDPSSVNHNKPKAKPGESAEAEFLHTDYGIAQLSGSTLKGYAGLAVLPWYEQRLHAMNAAWAIPAMVQTITGLLDWAAQVDAKIRGLGYAPAYGNNPTVLAGEAYNKGRSGAAIRAVFPFSDKLAVDLSGMVVRTPSMDTTNGRDVYAHTAMLHTFALADPSMRYGVALVAREQDYAERLGLTIAGVTRTAERTTPVAGLLT